MNVTQREHWEHPERWRLGSGASGWDCVNGGQIDRDRQTVSQRINATCCSRSRPNKLPCLFCVPHMCYSHEDMTICGHVCVVNLCLIECVFLQSSESVCMRGSERNGYIFRLASMWWDSTLQGLAASQTPLLPRKHAAACHWRGATQFNHVWLSVAHITEVECYTALQDINTTQQYWWDWILI